MNEQMLITPNVNKLKRLMLKLQTAPINTSKLALIYGAPGTGKSYAVEWCAFHNDIDAVRVEAFAGMTQRWFLEELARQLGLSPYYLSAHNIEIIRDELECNPRMIFIDEIDYLLDSGHIDVVRSVYDNFNVPVLMFGMEYAKDKIKNQNKALYSRIQRNTVYFSRFTLEETKKIIAQITDLKFSPEAIERIHAYTKDFRGLVNLLNEIENAAKANQTSNLEFEHVQGIINDPIRRAS